MCKKGGRQQAARHDMTARPTLGCVLFAMFATRHAMVGLARYVQNHVRQHGQLFGDR